MCVRGVMVQYASDLDALPIGTVITTAPEGEGLPYIKRDERRWEPMLPPEHIPGHWRDGLSVVLLHDKLYVKEETQ